MSCGVHPPGLVSASRQRFWDHRRRTSMTTSATPDVTRTGPIALWRPVARPAPSSSAGAISSTPRPARSLPRVPLCDAQEVETAAVVEAAAAAHFRPGQRNAGAVERAQVLFRFRELVQAHFDEMSASCVTREHGKTLRRGSGIEVQRGVEMIEFACGAPSPGDGPVRCENIARNVDCRDQSAIRSVFASGITPLQLPGDGPAVDDTRSPWSAATPSCSSHPRKSR